MPMLQRFPAQRPATAPPAEPNHADARVVIRWEISAEALRTCALPQIVAMNGQAARINGGRLEWSISGETAAASLILDVGEDDLTCPLIHSCPIHRAGGADSPFEHLEVPGHLVACLARGGSASPILYARTPLLDRLLGLPGGVYDSPALA